MTSMAPITTVLFDWGHTLFDTGDSLRFVVERSAALGHPIPLDEAARLHADALVASRRPEELAKGRDLDIERHRACWMDLWQAFEARCPGLAGELWRFETTPAGWQPYPDVAEVLADVRSLGVRIVIVSDVPFDLRSFFVAYDLSHLVDAYVLSSEHGVTKAEGGLFPIALAEAGCSAADALMVGDNPANDGQAPRWGIRTLLLPHVPSGTSRGLRAVVALVAESQRAGGS